MSAREERARKFVEDRALKTMRSVAARQKKQAKEKEVWLKEHCTTKEDYAEYLKDPQWLKRRSEIFELRGKKCMNCESTVFLHIHHIGYTGKYPWLAPDDDLICLCKACHNKAHSSYIDCGKLIREFKAKQLK